MKKNKKINWKKGIGRTSLVILALLTFFLVIPHYNQCNHLEKSQLTMVTVQPGDTLWKIANEYGNNQIDPRKLVYKIQKINKINAQIFPGQVINVPVIINK